jgi:hypothetical protein
VPVGIPQFFLNFPYYYNRPICRRITSIAGRYCNQATKQAMLNPLQRNLTICITCINIRITLFAYIRKAETAIILTASSNFTQLFHTNAKITQHIRPRLLSFGAFAKLRIATISFLMSVCLTVCLYVRPSAWNTSAPSERIFIKFDIRYFSKIC